MTVELDEQTFAELVGRQPNGVWLFRVSNEVLEAIGNEWRGPVELRFVKDEGRMVELEIRTYSAIRAIRE